MVSEIRPLAQFHQLFFAKLFEKATLFLTTVETMTDLINNLPFWWRVV